MSQLSTKAPVWTWRNGLQSKTSCISLFCHHPYQACPDTLNSAETKRNRHFGEKHQSEIFPFSTKAKVRINEQIPLVPKIARPLGALTPGSPYKDHFLLGQHYTLLPLPMACWIPLCWDCQLLWGPLFLLMGITNRIFKQSFCLRLIPPAYQVVAILITCI